MYTKSKIYNKKEYQNLQAKKEVKKPLQNSNHDIKPMFENFNWNWKFQLYQLESEHAKGAQFNANTNIGA